MKRVIALVFVTACTLMASCRSHLPPVRVVQLSGENAPHKVPEGMMWKVMGLVPYESEKGVGTADLYIDGSIWLGKGKSYNVSGTLEVLANAKQDSPIWILEGSTVRVGDSRQSVEAEEYPEKY